MESLFVNLSWGVFLFGAMSGGLIVAFALLALVGGQESEISIRSRNFEQALRKIANGPGYYGAQAGDYKVIARNALGSSVGDLPTAVGGGKEP